MYLSIIIGQVLWYQLYIIDAISNSIHNEGIYYILYTILYVKPPTLRCPMKVGGMDFGGTVVILDRVDNYSASSLMR